MSNKLGVLATFRKFAGIIIRDREILHIPAILSQCYWLLMLLHFCLLPEMKTLSLPGLSDG
jgi:hypothetical protein